MWIRCGPTGRDSKPVVQHPAVRCASAGLFSIRPNGTKGRSTSERFKPQVLRLRFAQDDSVLVRSLRSAQADSVLGGLLRHVRLGHTHGQITNAPDHSYPLGNADRPARVQQVEEI